MRFTFTALATICALTAATSSASADGWYFSEGFGITEINDQMGESFGGEHFTARIALGRQSGPWAIDAYVQILDLGGTEAVTLGVDARYIMKVSGPLQVYLRGGLNKMTLSDHTGGDYDRGSYPMDPRGGGYEGRGITYGAGVRLSGKVRALGLLYWPLFFTKWGPKVTASMWLDTSRQFVRLHNPRAASIDGELSTWTFGFSLGGGF